MSDAPRQGSRWRRSLLLAAGWVLTGLGVVGLVLPLLPGTVFLIAAAWCFSRSSPRFEAWLLGHEQLGPHVLHWRESGAIARKAKLIACGSMMLSFGLVAASAAPPIALWATGLCLLASGAYVASRPEPAREE